jgi:hypothetical protein
MAEDGRMMGAVYALSHYNPDDSPSWPVPAMSVEIVSFEARTKEGGTREYALRPVNRILPTL